MNIETGGRPRIRAIPTKYKNIEFRSKLEASVAACLDAAGVEWTYEQEGYDLDGVWYLPDFWLPKARQFIEVKGQLEDPSLDKAVALAHALQVEAGEDDEVECSRPARVVVLSSPFVARCANDPGSDGAAWVAYRANLICGRGYNGVEEIDSFLVTCPSCGVAFFMTACGQWVCSACGGWSKDLLYRAVEVWAEHRRGLTRYERVGA